MKKSRSVPKKGIHAKPKQKSRARESMTAKKRRAEKVFSRLREEYPDVRTALDFNTPFELLIATILSAQCTDARVNMVTPALFKNYKSPADFAAADLADLENEVRSTGFYHNKAKSIMRCSRALVDRFGGNVPRTMDELLSLEGVGRKTANVLLGNAFGIPGIAVDTHVGRLAQRLGFTQEEDPTKIEFDLMEIFPPENWILLCHLLMAHGRKVCNARQPNCEACSVQKYCPSAFRFPAKKGK